MWWCGAEEAGMREAGEELGGEVGPGGAFHEGFASFLCVRCGIGEVSAA